MLSTVYSNTPFIQVSAPAIPFINNSPMAGQVRWNTQYNYMEVSTGSGWQQIGGIASITVSAEFTMIMDWARKEMAKSYKIKTLADQSPTVADALAAYELAAEKLEVIMTLADKELL
jgi:glycyl-tRNA synthetase alpha subunit